MSDDRHRFVVVGAGPAGNAAATTAATLGARVVMIEDAIVGGAAHLRDCLPSKAMVASSMRLFALRTADRLGVAAPDGAGPDLPRLEARLERLSADVSAGTQELLRSQGVEIHHGRGRLTADRTAVADVAGITEMFPFDSALVSTGSSPRVPAWARVDGERVLTTRDAYGLDALPEHLVIIGSGVTGVEFVHIFSSLGSKVTLLVSRQQVLPHRDPEVAALLEEIFLEREVGLLKGARASAAYAAGGGVVVEIEDGRRVEGSHVLLAVGSVPNTAGLGLEEAGVATDGGGFVVVDEFLRTTASGIYAAGDVTGQMPLSSVAAMQGRKVAAHALGRPVKPLDYGKMAQAIFTEPEIASVGLEEADAVGEGRKVRITKVPFAANARARIQGTPRGFVKVVSDPATHEVLGGTVVGHHASELIATLAVAVQARLKVDVLAETLMVYPSLSESLMDAAD
jgi:dihydrolipoamide dehydrogenase